MGFFRHLQLFTLIITLITNTFWITKLIAINLGYSGIHEFVQTFYLVIRFVLAGNIKCWGCSHMHHQEGHWFWCICGGKFSILYKFLWLCICTGVNIVFSRPENLEFLNIMSCGYLKPRLLISSFICACFSSYYYRV